MDEFCQIGIQIRWLDKNLPAFEPNTSPASNLSFSIGESIDTLNFGDRSKLTRVKLKVFLPNDFVKAANILIDSLGSELIIEPRKTDWDGFINVSLADNGVYHYDLLMKALYEMTKRC